MDVVGARRKRVSASGIDSGNSSDTGIRMLCIDGAYALKFQASFSRRLRAAGSTHAGGQLVPIILSPALQAFEDADSCTSAEALVLTQSQAMGEGKSKRTQGHAGDGDQPCPEQKEAQAGNAPVQEQEQDATPPITSSRNSQQEATPVTTSAPCSTTGQFPAQGLPMFMHVVPAVPLLPCAVAPAPSTQPEDSLPTKSSMPGAAPETRPGPADPSARLPLPALPLDSDHVSRQHLEQLSTSAGSNQPCASAQQMAAMSSQMELPSAVACSAALSPAAAAASQSTAEPFLPFTPSLWGAEVGANPMHISEGLGADDDLFSAWHLGGYGAQGLQTCCNMWVLKCHKCQLAVCILLMYLALPTHRAHTTFTLFVTG